MELIKFLLRWHASFTHFGLSKYNWQKIREFLASYFVIPNENVKQHFYL